METQTQKLIGNLMSQTQELRKAYVSKTVDFATSEFESLEHLFQMGLSETYFAEHLGFKTEMKKERYSERISKRISDINGVEFHNTEHARTLAKFMRNVYSIRTKGKERFVDAERKRAETHYVNSIEKLGARIIKKGIDLDTFTMETSYFDPNISTVIKDASGKTVRAWTIIAAGIVQRPHYRYLIK